MSKKLVAQLVAGAALVLGVPANTALGHAELQDAEATRRPVAMVPGLQYDHRTMIPRGICPADSGGGL